MNNQPQFAVWIRYAQTTIIIEVRQTAKTADWGRQITPFQLCCSFKTPCSNIVGATFGLLSRASREERKNSVVTGVPNPDRYERKGFESCG